MSASRKHRAFSVRAISLTLGVLVGSVNSASAQCEQQLWAPDGAVDDMFGAYVATFDDVAVISATLHDNDGGAAYVYRRRGSQWVFEAELQAPVRARNDWFGTPAVYEDLILVGSHLEDTNGLVDSGAAYVFRWDGAQWLEEAKLVPSDAAAGDRFGWGNAAWLDLVAVSAIRDDDVGTDSGAVYLFRKVGGTWVEEAKLLPSAGTSLQEFGFGVDILGNRVFVGAPQQYRTRSDTGAAYVFRNDSGTWVEEAVLLASDGMIGDEFGSDLCADGDQLVVGARGASGWRGSCYVFRRTGTTWVEEAKVTPDDGGGWYGIGVGLRGNTLVVGAIFNQGSGSAYVYQWDGNQWSLESKLHHSDLPSGSRFGNRVDMGDDYYLIGASMRGSSDIGVGPGTAYIYGTCEWTWENFADGWPGTLGIPELTADTDLPPLLTIDIGNSFGPPTVGFLLVGLSKTAIETPWDGELCVLPAAPVMPYLIPVRGLTLVDELPADLPVDELFLQVLELDLGASQGVSFTRGLHLRF